MQGRAVSTTPSKPTSHRLRGFTARRMRPIMQRRLVVATKEQISCTIVFIECIGSSVRAEDRYALRDSEMGLLSIEL